MEFEEKTIKRTEIFAGQVIRLAVDDVLLPEGKGEAKRELIFHNGAVAVLALTPENKLILVKQYRKAIEALSYELPAGKLEVGENADPKAAALRELEEETGYGADLELLYDFYTAIGFCNEKVKLYLAKNLVKLDQPRPQDEDETLEVYQVSLAEAKELLKDGLICDAKTIMALQYWEMKENLKK